MLLVQLLPAVCVPFNLDSIRDRFLHNSCQQLVQLSQRIILLISLRDVANALRGPLCH
jgi:hypothetical protein